MHAFGASVAVSRVQTRAGQRGHHLVAAEAAGSGLGFAALEDRGAEAATCVRRIDEECANLRCIDRGIELGLVASRTRITAEQRAPLAPAAAGDELAVRFRDEVGAIQDQLRVDAERAAQRAFDLRRRVVIGAELARGARDQVDELGLVVERRVTRELTVHQAMP